MVRRRLQWIGICCLLMTLASGASTASTTKLEAGPVELKITAGGALPVVVAYDDGGTPASPGDDSGTLFQNVDHIAVRADLGKVENTGVPARPPAGNTAVAVDFSDTRVYNDVWPTLTHMDREYEARAPEALQQTLYFYFEPHGMDLGYCILGKKEVLGKSLLASCRPFPQPLRYPFYGYEYWKLNASFDYAYTDWYVESAEYEYYLPCRQLQTFRINGCPLTQAPFPGQALREATPNVSAGYRVGTGRVFVHAEGGHPEPSDGSDLKPVPPRLAATPATGARTSVEPAAISESAAGQTGEQPSQGPQHAAHSVAIPLPGVGAESGTEWGQPLLAVALAVALVLIPVGLLYHRLSRNEILSNRTRARILETIRAEPGVHERALAHRLGIHPSTVDYHARLLHRYGFIEVVHTENEKCYFENAGRFSREDRVRIIASRSRTALGVLALVRERGPLSLTELARLVAIRRQSLAWHVKALSDAGVVRIRRSGRCALVEVGDLPASPWLPRVVAKVL